MVMSMPPPAMRVMPVPVTAIMPFVMVTPIIMPWVDVILSISINRKRGVRYLDINNRAACLINISTAVIIPPARVSLTCGCPY